MKSTYGIFLHFQVFEHTKSARIRAAVHSGRAGRTMAEKDRGKVDGKDKDKKDKDKKEKDKEKKHKVHILRCPCGGKAPVWASPACAVLSSWTSI